MTERYDAIECEMGISAYASTQHEGFAAVLKARYSDFVVHEVDVNGNVARLESLPVITEVPDEEETKETETEASSRKRKHDEQQQEEDDGGDDVWTKASRQLSQWVGPESSEQVMTMLQHWESTTTTTEEQEDDNISAKKKDDGDDVQKYVILPPLSDKDTRRSVHEWVRSSLSGCALADTMDGKVRIWHKRFEKEMPNYGKFDNNRSGNNQKKKKKKPWPSDRPDYLRFVLYKENMDTSFAVKEISRRLLRMGGGKPKKLRVGYAGMKDKRGVTTQFCTLYQREPNDMVALNQNSSGGSGGGNTSKGGVSVFRVGNFSFVPDEVYLGRLSGNRFDVVLRNVEMPCGDDADAPEERIQHTKACLEKAALSLRHHGFINYFGMQRFGKYYDTHKVGIAVLKGDFETAVKIIMQPKPDEVPRTSNARALWENRFADLDSSADLAAKEKAESNAAKRVLRDMGRFMTCEVAILNSLMRKPLNYKRAFCCIPKNLRQMFLHAYQSYLWNRVASYRVEKMGREEVVLGDLVLTHDKTEEQGGSGTSGLGGKTVKVVNEEDVASGKYAVTDVVLPLVGKKVRCPQNSSGELFDTLLLEEGLRKDSFAEVQDRELALGGDYRRMICRPNDVDYEIKEYHDPLQPLLQTDLMKVDRIALGPQNSSAETETMASDNEKGTDANRRVLLAMIIGFTLPASSYATIALRELMKRPTSSDYQRKLVLEGPCEQNLNGEKIKEN